MIEIRISFGYEIFKGLIMVVIVIIVVEIGEVYMLICEVIVVMDSGCEGFIFCFFVIFVMIGRVVNVICLVLYNMVMKNVMVGVRKVIFFGLCCSICLLSIISSFRLLVIFIVVM